MPDPSLSNPSNTPYTPAAEDHHATTLRIDRHPNKLTTQARHVASAKPPRMPPRAIGAKVSRLEVQGVIRRRGRHTALTQKSGPLSSGKAVS